MKEDTPGTMVFSEAISEQVRAAFDAKSAAREQALSGSREVIRHAALAIRAIHRHEYERAAELIARASQGVATAERVLQSHPEVLHAGFVHDAAKEYAEAAITLALVTDRPMPGPTELQVGFAAYLNGAAEAVGELRRFLLDQLRHGTPETLKRCESLLTMMEDIYSVLVTMDYPDAITGGLRRNTDMVRGVLERTRGDLTLALLQSRLHDQLRGIMGDQALPAATLEE